MLRLLALSAVGGWEKEIPGKQSDGEHGSRFAARAVSRSDERTKGLFLLGLILIPAENSER